jgi:hypothetical protein
VEPVWSHLKRSLANPANQTLADLDVATRAGVVLADRD